MQLKAGKFQVVVFEANSDTRKLIHDNFDKLLILCLLVFFTGVMLHIIHDVEDAGTINWSMSIVSGLIGSLTTLIVGKAVNRTSVAGDVQVNAGSTSETSVKEIK